MSSPPTDEAGRDAPATPRPAARSWPARLAGFLAQQLFALAVFVGFPALVTAIAPVSWVQFERHDGRVSASARICLLFVVPYRTLTVDPVVGVGDRFVAGTVTRERRSGGRDRETKSEDKGFLVIQGPEHAAEVPVTPFNLRSVLERSEAFLQDPEATELQLFVVANWKFSVIAGGLISLLTVLYVAALAFGIVLKTIHGAQWAAGVPPQRRLLVRYLK